MVPTPARPVAEQDEPVTSAPDDPVAAAFPDIGDYVDLVSELEEILRSAGEPAATDDAEPVQAVRDAPVEPAPERPAVPPAARPAPLRARAVPARPAQREPDHHDTPAPHADALPDPGFWQVDDSSWASAPAWRETRRTRRADLLIIGALVVLIAGGGAYSALRFGDASTDLAGDAIAAEASRAETGLGVPFAPVGRAGLLRDDPTEPVPSLDAALAGAEVPPLPVIIEPPVEVTQPLLLANAADAPAATPPPPAAEPAAAAVDAPAAVGGPLVPFAAADLEGGVAVAIVTTVTTWVNMRAGPDNGEPVVMVVSPDTPVSVRACDYWCSVTVDGRDGYIFQDFLVARP